MEEREGEEGGRIRTPIKKQGWPQNVQSGTMCIRIKSHTDFENKRAQSVLHRKNNGLLQKMSCAVLREKIEKLRKAF
jgi:Fe-S cluster biosynthesis and repair protein YggX